MPSPGTQPGSRYLSAAEMLGEVFHLVLHYSRPCGQEPIELGRNSSRLGPLCCQISPLPVAMGSDSFYSCWVFWQDDVKSSAEGLPSYKLPPPPPPLAQPRKPGSQDPKPLSSASSHSGIIFSAPRNRSPPAGTTPAPEAPSAQDAPSSPIYASVSPAKPGAKRPLDAHLALVNQHPIGPFPRVQSPPHLKSPTAEATVAGGCLPPPSPTGRPEQTGTNQHFVLVEVHRPDSEPDVNEVRALPQTRSEYAQTLGAGWALVPTVILWAGGRPLWVDLPINTVKVEQVLTQRGSSGPGVPPSW